MATATHIQEFGNEKVVIYSDGRKALFVPTGGNLWLNTNPPYPELELPPFDKTVINPNIDFLSGNRAALWAATVGSNIVVAARIGTVSPRRIYYSTNGGISWTLSDAPDGNSGQYNWYKVIGDKIYTGGANLMLSEDGGQTWDVVYSNPIAGIAKSPTTYVAIPPGYNASQPGATSSDGVNFTGFTPTLNHLDGEAFNGYSLSGQGLTNSIEYYNNNFYSFGQAHKHFPDADFPRIGTSEMFTMFVSANGTTWNEFEIGGIDAPLAIWIGSIGPYFNFLNDTFLITTPWAGSYGYFHWLFGSWNYDPTDPQPTNPVSSADIPGTADLLGGWLNYSHGRAWFANNLGSGDGVSNAYDGSDILVSSPPNSWLPFPIFNEDAWYVTAKTVDQNDDLLVFERGTNLSAGGGAPINANTRLVRIAPSA